MKKRNKVLLFTSIGIATVLLWVAFIFPLPYYVESPGGASDIRSVLTVKDKEDSAKGSYNFVYVQVKKATAVQLLMAYFDKNSDIYTEKEMTGGSNSEDYYRISQFYMETSQNMAKYQALKLAGEEASMDFFGVYVLNVADNSTFKSVLNIADTVTGVNGKTFKSSKELIQYVGSLKIGDEVSVQYVSQDQKLSANGKIIKLENGKNGIGIGLVDHTEVKSKTPIQFETGNIGGPSAGLMFTLAIYTQLANPDLRAGRTIAGTGTIEQDGSVGDIGGADKKVLSAAKAGASIFFVPNNPVEKEVRKVKPNAKTNYEEALEAVKENKLDIKVVPVKTVQNAIDYLEKTKGE
ncbi:SepM family pheromone-processing serine protease [Streptococcus gallinaceus]|uniref:endopeptidase La n=1 Tax=Streptococcus gallinaceus TaxID=165758 RepID=A0ABV2JMX9_9STRE